jgi:hypothetical protein
MNETICNTDFLSVLILSPTARRPKGVGACFTRRNTIHVET